MIGGIRGGKYNSYPLVGDGAGKVLKLGEWEEALEQMPTPPYCTRLLYLHPPQPVRPF